MRQVRLELTPPLIKSQVPYPLWLLTRGNGTERTRTVIGLLDKQMPHLSATAPEKVCGKQEQLAVCPCV